MTEEEFRRRRTVDREHELRVAAAELVERCNAIEAVNGELEDDARVVVPLGALRRLRLALRGTVELAYA